MGKQGVNELRRRKSIIVVAIILGIVFLMVRPISASEPPGFTADQGTVYPGDYYAWIKGSYDDQIWSYVDVSESRGDFYLRGSSGWADGDTIEYIVIIKIKPQDTSLTHVELKVESDFYYGISAELWCSASWHLEYVVMDMSTSTPYYIGWSAYEAEDSVSGGIKDNQHYSTPDSWKILYDEEFYHATPEDIDPYDWNYVGVKIKCQLSGYSDFYRYSGPTGIALFDPDAIHFRFY
jgi:hypothetical protein